MKTGSSRASLLALASIAAGLAGSAQSVYAHGFSFNDVDAPRWSFDPWIVVPLAAALLLFAIGVARLHHRSGATANRRWQIGAYLAGWFALAGALVSPLHWLGERLFTFHMIEHEIVMAVAAPLLVLARPAGLLLWGLAGRLRRATGAAARRLRGPWQWLTSAGNATWLHGLAIWVWHVPPLFDAAISSVPLHRAQHLSFLLTALLFWWSMLRRSNPGSAIWHLFLTMMHTSVLGALMTLAPRVLYQLQTAAAPLYGLTPLEDQQLAGVIMWVPAETVYAGAALALAAKWLRASDAPGQAAPAMDA